MVAKGLLKDPFPVVSLPLGLTYRTLLLTVGATAKATRPRRLHGKIPNSKIRQTSEQTLHTFNLKLKCIRAPYEIIDIRREYDLQN